MANQRFQIQFDFQANMGPIKTQIQDLQKTLGGINLPSNVASNFEKLFGKLDSEMSNFQAMTKNGFNNMADVNKAQTAFGRITKIINQIGLEAQRVKGIDPNKLIPKEAQTKIEGLTNKLKELQSQQAKKNQFAEQIKKQNDLINKQEKELQDLETKRRALMDDAKSLGGQKGAATKRRNEAQALLNKAMADRDALIAKGTSNTAPEFQAAKKDVDTYSKAVRDAQNQIDTLTNKLNTNATQMRNNGASTEIAQRRLNELQTEMTEMQGIQVSPQGLLELRQELAKLMGVNLDDIPNDLNLIQSTINGLNEGKLNQLNQNLLQMDTNLDGIGSSTNNARNGMQGFVQSASGLNEAAQDMENFKNQFKYFFSMTNSVQLFKRAVTSALNTVKELDATMTEAAVVTEFDVGDMWEKLPQYSANAQKLGVSINGMYQATTLYYQQGLKTNEAMAIGIETMKMARIAGMESAEATEAMTAALRGFNMELNEASATRVNDVYSQLAAVTAADTNQIATAMSKTASIAASANMEFETTAALLAQIIETTQEAPETAGTALKTIIARFSEVKSLRDQGQTTGKDSEGEDIDVNKIQTALRTVGISMEGFFAGTEGLDSILLKLAGKWEGLDFETQRYIATMAAGSRQQSRFIAMMSDYKRTAELVGEAQNSAGASAKQFEKTLESMESKIQRLENAWNEFLMGLANNEILKGAIDLVTSFVSGINSLTNGLSNGNGLLKSFVSLMVTLGGLSMGKAALSGGLGWIGKQMGMKSVEEVQKTTLADRHKQWNQQKGGRRFVGFISSKETTKRAQDRAENFGINRAVKQNKNLLNQTKGPEEFAERLKASTTETEKNKAAMDAANKTYADMIGQNKSAETAAAEATKEFERQGGTLINTSQEQEILSKSTTKLGVDYKALGGYVMGAGAAFGGLAVLLSTAGLDEAAEGVGKISGILMGLGAVISFLGPAIQGLAGKIAAAGITAGMAWAWAFILVAIIGVLLITVVSLGSGAKSAAEEMAELESQTKALAEAADAAEESMSRLAETQKDLVDLQNTMAGLVKGTDEWNKALIESNNKVLELLDTYPELAEYISFNEDMGLLEISVEGWNTVMKSQVEAYAEASAAKLALQAKKTAVSYTLIEEDDSLSSSERAAREKALDIQGDIQVEEFYRQVAAVNAGLKNNEFSEYSATVLATQGLDNFVVALNDAAEAIELNEQAYQEYADIMGITLEEAKEANKVDVKNTLAAKRIQKYAADRMKQINAKMAGLSNDELKLAKALLSKDGSQITSSQASDLAKGELNDLKDALGLTNEEFRGLEDIVGKVNGTFGALEETIDGLGIDGAALVNLLKNSTYQVAYGITSKIAELEASGAESNQINQWFTKLLENKDEKQQKAILETLAVTNWRSIEDLNDTFSTFADKGLLDPNIADGLRIQMKELAKAVSDNTAVQLQETGYRLVDLIEMIKSGEIDQNQLNTEQKQLIKNATGAEDSDFVRLGTDNWQYKGDLYSKTVKLYADNLEGQNLGIESAKEDLTKAKTYKRQNFSWQVEEINDLNYQAKRKLTDSEVMEIGRAENTYGLSVSDASNIQQAYINWQQEGRKEGTGKTFTEYVTELGYGDSLPLVGEDEDILKEKAERIEKLYKIMAYYFNEPADLTDPVQQLAKINEWSNKWGDLEAYEAQYSQAVEDEANLVQTDISRTTAELGWEKMDNVEDQIQYNKTRRGALENRLLSTGGTVFVDKIAKEFEEAGVEAENFADIINALASDMAVVASRTKTYATNMSNLSGALNKNKNDPEYGRALAQAKINTADYFGISLDQLDAAGISEEIYNELAKGSHIAFKDLGEQLATALITNGQPVEEFLNSLQLSPVMDEAAILRLYQALGGSEEYFNSNMEEALSFISTRLTMMGRQFTYQIGANKVLTGGVSVINPTDFYIPSGGGGGGGKWENPYDKLHNTLEEINELLRERERIERRYQRLITRGEATAAKLLEERQKQLENISKEIEKQKELQAGREAQVAELIAQNPDMAKYVYTEEVNGEQVIRIDWEAINNITDPEEGERVTEFYEKLQAWLEELQEIGVTLEDLEDQVYELSQEGKDEYLSLEDRIKEAIIFDRQAEIDKLSEINDSINDTNSKLIESMQSAVDKYRQDRENEKTEEELSDKQRRLAYLQQDTSGANALEILQLQKEIEEGQESYTDQLIDQKISELQEQNDKAAEQRQQQIDIMQAQLDKYVESGEIWDEVYTLMEEGLDENNGLIRGSRLEELLKSAIGFDGLSKISQMEWLKDINTSIAQALAYLQTGRQLENLGVEAGTQVQFVDENGQVRTGTVDENGNVILDDGTVYENVYQGADGRYYAGSPGKKPEEKEKEKEEEKENPGTEPVYQAEYKNLDGVLKTTSKMNSEYAARNAAMQDINDPQAISELEDELSQQFYGMDYDTLKGKNDGRWIDVDMEIRHRKKMAEESIKVNQYKTGGIADFTGPAWLDGTKSKPEYVLNAEQTRAFFTLVDVLGSLQAGNAKTAQNSGDNTYDIDINVESIGSDYDVEQLAETIKRLINEDARYRNNNTINLMR